MLQPSNPLKINHDFSPHPLHKNKFYYFCNKYDSNYFVNDYDQIGLPSLLWLKICYHLLNSVFRRGYKLKKGYPKAQISCPHSKNCFSIDIV